MATSGESSSRVRCLLPCADALGEGPVWHEGRLFWVDIYGCRIHALDPDSGAHQLWSMPDQVGFLVPTRAGDFIVGLKRGLARVRLGDGSVQVTDLGSPEPHLPENRFNDGRCDRQGRLWCGTMHDGQPPRAPTGGQLYRYDQAAGGAPAGFLVMDGPYEVPNGPAFSPDGRVLYHSDTERGIVHAYDLTDGGALENKRVFIRLGQGDGLPDGLTTDTTGHLWVARFSGWGLDRYGPGGALIDRVQLPVSNVTCCTFGGERLDRLFVTTARTGLDDRALEAQPLAGGLFEVLETRANGLPVSLFQG